MTKGKEQVSSLICPLPAPHTCLLVLPPQLRPQEEKPKGGGDQAVAQLPWILFRPPFSLGGPRTKISPRLMTRSPCRPLPESPETQGCGSSAVRRGGEGAGSARQGVRPRVELEVLRGPGKKIHWRCGVTPWMEAKGETRWG